MAEPIASTEPVAGTAPQNKESVSTATAVPCEGLRWCCDPVTLGFATTSEVPALEGTTGQERGVDAVSLGLALDTSDFHVFVAGPTGSGRTTTVRALVAHAAGGSPAAPDWCYLHNFGRPSQPIAVQLPAGRTPARLRTAD